jgi:hypothetical protein
MDGLLVRVLVIAVALVAETAAVASAAEDPEALIHQGVELRKKGDDIRAEGYFRRAYELAQTPRAAAQLGLVEMALGVYPEAERYLTDALASQDAWVRANNQVLQQTLDKARAQLVRVRIAGAPAGATVSTPARGTLKLPSDKTVWLPPGATSVHVEAAGMQAADVKVSGAAGETRDVTVTMPAEPTHSPGPGTVGATEQSSGPTREPEGTITRPESSPPAPSAGSGLRWGGVATGAAGVAAAVVGGVLFAAGNTKRDNLQSPTHPYDASDENWKTYRGAGIGLLVGGGALLAGGITMFVLGWQQEHAATGASSVALSGGAGPGFGLLRINGRF